MIERIEAPADPIWPGTAYTVTGYFGYDDQPASKADAAYAIEAAYDKDDNWLGDTIFTIFTFRPAAPTLPQS